jgi:hypothetical protein
MRCHFLSNYMIDLSIKRYRSVGTDLKNGPTAKNHRFLNAIIGRSSKWNVGWLERCNSGSIAVLRRYVERGLCKRVMALHTQQTSKHDSGDKDTAFDELR